MAGRVDRRGDARHHDQSRGCESVAGDGSAQLTSTTAEGAGTMVSSWLVSRVSGADVGPERSGALLGWSAGRSHTPSRSHFHVVRRTTEPSRECKNSAPRVPAALKMPALNQREAGDGRKL